MAGITDIGLNLEKISEEEVAEYLEDLIIQNLKTKINFDLIDNLNITVTITKKDTLDVDISADIQLKKNASADIQSILDEAINSALKTFEGEMRQKQYEFPH